MLNVLNDLRLWLLRGLQAVLGLTFVLVVASAVWGLSSLLGDDSGAAVARGVVAVGGILWLAVLAVLVVLLAWDRIVADKALTTPVIPANLANRPSPSVKGSLDPRSGTDRQSEA